MNLRSIVFNAFFRLRFAHAADATADLNHALRAVWLEWVPASLLTEDKARAACTNSPTARSLNAREPAMFRAAIRCALMSQRTVVEII
jgi:hypothetical protein